MAGKADQRSLSRAIFEAKARLIPCVLVVPCLIGRPIMQLNLNANKRVVARDLLDTWDRGRAAASKFGRLFGVNKDAEVFDRGV